jgi:hypothetical protein
VTFSLKYYKVTLSQNKHNICQNNVDSGDFLYYTTCNIVKVDDGTAKG